MGQVTITLNGRTYRLRCGDGEEQRLIALSDHVRGKIDQLAAELGQVGDDRLMVMAALLVADELFEARARLAEMTAVDPSLFEPLPEIAKPVASPAHPTALSPSVSTVAVSANQLPEPPPTARPTQPATPAPAPVLEPPSDPTNTSLKRALRRPQAKQSLEERLAEARDNPQPERPSTERKAGSA